MLVYTVIRGGGDFPQLYENFSWLILDSYLKYKNNMKIIYFYKINKNLYQISLSIFINYLGNISVLHKIYYF